MFLTKQYTTNSTAPLLLRLALGVIFFAHGAQKVLGWFGGFGLAGTTGYFHQALGIPIAVGYLVAFVEFLGGISLVLGLIARPFALAIFIEMIVATIMVHLPVGFFMNWGAQAGRGEGFEFNIILIAASLALFLLGPGLYSLDAVLFGARSKGPRALGDMRFANQH